MTRHPSKGNNHHGHQEGSPAKTTEAPKGPFVHQLQLYLVGGQQFTVNEVTDTVDMPRNVIAFVNAWREKKDVWHSPNNDPRFGVRVRDVSMIRIPRRPSGPRLSRPKPPRRKKRPSNRLTLLGSAHEADHRRHQALQVGRRP